MVEKKKLLLRLDPDLAEHLQAVAEVEWRPMSEVVREAIRALIEDRRKDDAFQRRLHESAREHDRTLRALRASES